MQRIEIDMKPKAIMREIKLEGRETTITPKDISSIKQQKRKGSLLGTTDTHLFLDSFDGLYYDYEVDHGKHLLCGFMMDPRSVKMLQLYSSVLRRGSARVYS